MDLVLPAERNVSLISQLLTSISILGGEMQLDEWDQTFVAEKTVVSQQRQPQTISQPWPDTETASLNKVCQYRFSSASPESHLEMAVRFS